MITPASLPMQALWCHCWAAEWILFIVHHAHRLPFFIEPLKRLTTRPVGIVTFLARIEGIGRGGHANVRGGAAGLGRFHQRGGAGESATAGNSIGAKCRLAPSRRTAAVVTSTSPTLMFA